MIYTYFADCSFLGDEFLYKKAWDSVSLYRQKKVEGCLKNKDKLLSLCSGLLLSFALMKHFGISERETVFVPGENGRPKPSCHPEIFFNISHSGSIACVSVGDRPCGVDVEKIRKVNLKIAEKYFSEEEKNYAKSHESFLKIWTLKEATAKAAGKGIFGSLKKLYVNPENEKIKFCENTYFFTQHKIYNYIITISSQSAHIKPPAEIMLEDYLNTI